MKRIILFLIACLAALAQVAEQANSGYKTPEGRARVARMMLAEDRDERQKPRELIEAMELKPGMTVADVGTGPGYMLPFLSEAVGPQGRVLSQDLHADFIEQAKKRAADLKLSNVTFVQGTEKHPGLPDDSADVILVLDAYHHFNYPQPMLAGVARALRDGGKLVLVDYYKDGFRGDPGHIRADADEVVKELEASGFRLLTRRDHVPGSQYLLILEEK